MKNTKFECLYRKYLDTPLSSGKRYKMYKQMVKSARKFHDWVIVYKYGDNWYQYLAEEKMKAKVLDGKNSSEVQKNILELFEIVTDENEQNEILEAFLAKFHSDDDTLFCMVLSPWVEVFLEEMPLEGVEEALEKKEKELEESYSSVFEGGGFRGLGRLSNPFLYGHLGENIYTIGNKDKLN